METRLPRGTHRPATLQRAVSGSAITTLSSPASQHRPYQPSRLGSTHNVRSVSQPSALVDLTSDVSQEDSRSSVFFAANNTTSPEAIVIDDDDDQELPPAKRAKTGGDGFRTTSLKEERAISTANRHVPGSPLPDLPTTTFSRSNTPSSNARKRAHNHGNSPARQAHGIDPPPMAVRVPAPKQVADFAPWTGHHPEDIMSETVIKSGYFDKPSNQNESNSARPTIWPNLSQKNHMGLQTLSYLFTQVLEKKQALGKCTAPSTFKPPPRVTVTDTKREAWLRDLANPEVPLRKQSRTIPHGIRGKLLMEQCLSKDIPLARAVWLAKCVGANELRAFKRKGVSGAAAASGETKWIREWTVAVEQFLDSVVASCGQQDWQSHMNYTVRLATHFYVERLLDMDHFLDWIVSSLRDATLERLPIWLVLAQLFWKDITRFVQRGRKLAESLLHRLHVLTENGSAADEAFRVRLRNLVVTLAVKQRSCLVGPQAWQKYGHLLEPASAIPAVKLALEQVRLRNERLLGIPKSSPIFARSTLVDLYSELDASGLDVDIGCLSHLSSQSEMDANALISAILDWAATPYRSGISRIYVAAKIIFSLACRGWDTDQAVFCYLEDSNRAAAVDARNVFLVIDRLISLQCFSTGRYLQRLITRSAVTPAHSSLAFGLLTALQVDQLPPHVRNLRQTLLQRFRLVQEEPDLVAEITANFDSCLAERDDSGVVVDRSVWPKSLSGVFAVRAHVHKRLAESKDDVAGLGVFCVFRDWLEALEDVPAMADLIHAALQTEHLLLLATVTDTVNMHARAFAALEQLTLLTDKISEKYRILRSQQPLEKAFIVALSGFAERLPRQESLLKLLESDLPICEQQNMSAVCSPASDNLIGVQPNSLESDTDIDAVFASGNSMDQQLMERIYNRIMQRAQKDGAEGHSRVCSWLQQLRCFDAPAFDQLALRSVQTCLENPASSSAVGIANLIAGGCWTFQSMADLAELVNIPEAAAMTVRMLTSAAFASAVARSDDSFRYKLLAQRFCDEHSAKVLGLVRRAFELQEVDVDFEAVADLFIKYVSRASDDATSPFTEQSGRGNTLFANTARLFTTLVSKGVPEAAERKLDPRLIMLLANALSAKFCARALKFFMEFDKFKGDDCDKVVFGLMAEAITVGNIVWPQILKAVDDDTKRSLHGWAQSHLLFDSGDGSDKTDPNSAFRYLEVMGMTRHTVKQIDDQAVVVALVEKLKDVEKQLFAREEQDHVMQHLQVLLHVCSMSIHSSVTEGDSARQALADLLIALCAILVHQQVQTRGDIHDHLFDVASTLYSSFSEAVVAIVARWNSAGKNADPRVLSIVGDMSSLSSDAWLALASQLRPPGSQQQQALAKHAQGQTSSRGPPNSATQTPAQTAQRNWLGQGTVPKLSVEMKTTPYPLRRWELMPDATPSMGGNDASLSLALFAARKV